MDSGITEYAAGRRIEKVLYEADGETIDQTVDSHYSEQYQVLEERVDERTKAQYLWSPFYVDELIMRDYDSTADTEGGMDDSFSGDGMTTLDLGAAASAQAVAIQDDGKIVVAGYVEGATPSMVVARYLPDGTPDEGFGDAGVQSIQFPNQASTQGWCVAIQPDGKILVGGTAAQDFALARFNTDGTLDESFGEDDNGMVTADLNGNEVIYALALQSDGKIVAVGKYANIACRTRPKPSDSLSCPSCSSMFNSLGDHNRSGVIPTDFQQG